MDIKRRSVGGSKRRGTAAGSEIFGYDYHCGPTGACVDNPDNGDQRCGTTGRANRSSARIFRCHAAGDGSVCSGSACGLASGGFFAGIGAADIGFAIARAFGSASAHDDGPGGGPLH